MVLVLKNDQMENLLPMPEEIEAIEQAFRELGQGKAMIAPRARLRTPWKEEGGQYYFNNIMGLVPGMKSMALASIQAFRKKSRSKAASGGFIPATSSVWSCSSTWTPAISWRSWTITSSRPSRRRHERGGQQVSRAQRRQSHGACLGSGEQAKTQVTAHACVRQLNKVKVYSPTKENRESLPRK